MTRKEICNSMTLQDAIQVFRDTNAYGTMDIAKTVILEALEQKKTSDDCISRKAVIEQASDYGSGTFLIPVNAVKALPSVTPQPNEDWDAVIDELNRIGRNAFKDDTDYDNLFNLINSLPSATPQPKTGYWIRKERADDGICCECSNCGHRSLLIYDYIGFEDDHETWSMFDFDTVPLQNKNYCSDCGLKMKSEANE